MIPIFRAATEGSGTGTTDLVLILPRWLRAGPTLYSPVLAEAPRRAPIAGRRSPKKGCASAGRPWAEKLCRIRRFLTL
jgi:hypothetical protein